MTARDEQIHREYWDEFHTLAVIGRKHHLTRERIRQIVNPFGVKRSQTDVLKAKLRRGAVRNTTTGCLEWRGYCRPNGYGLMNKEYTHRLAYRLFIGAIPKDKPDIMHSCDNPPCIEPTHLRPGTQAENNEDRDRKGRGKAFARKTW